MKKALLFKEVPEGTYYKEGAWSWVKDSTAKEYLDAGYAVEWDVENKEPKKAKKPDSNSTVAEIKEYLKSQDVNFDSNALKSELLELVG